MVHDYAGRIKTSKKKKPFMLWMLMSVGAMVVMGSIIYFKLTHFSLPPTPSVQKKLPVLVQIPKKTLPKLQFEFYTLLPNMDMKVPGSEEAVTVSKPNFQENAATSIQTESETSPSVSSAGQFILQIASLKSEEAAVALQHRVAEWGVKSHIEMVQAGPSFWYRILSEPYGSENQVEEIKTLLHDHQINSFVVPLKKGSSTSILQQ